MNTEILAPVGNYEMLYAAIAGGANAVYLAGKSFGARAYANNFDLNELEDIIKICHFNDIKVYITVNTLIKEREIKSVLDFINDIYLIGVDAIILQDIGLASLVRNFFPDLNIHASTQISANSLMAVNFLDDLGFSRAILAREVDIDEISYIHKNSSMELEVFVHGSLCVSYSGKCLMSSFKGGRSGNRGRCAQPCRKKYNILDENNNIIFKDISILSPRDLALKSDVIKVVNSGACSLKIEGRMKKPEYVYATSKYYSSIIKNIFVNSEIVDEVSNRGFTRGHIFNESNLNYIDLKSESIRGVKIGIIQDGKFKSIKLIRNVKNRDSIEISLLNKKYTITADRDYKKGEKILLKEFDDAVVNSEAYRISSVDLRDRDFKAFLYSEKREIDMTLFAYIGYKPKLVLNYKNHSVKIIGDKNIEEGKKIIVDYDYAYNQLSKLGNDLFSLRKLRVNTDNKSFLSAKMLNELRRKGTKKLYDNITKKYYRNKKTIKLKNKRYGFNLEDFKISLSVGKLNQELLEDERISRVYLRDIDSLNFINDNYSEKIYYELPPVLGDDDYKNIIEKIIAHRSKIKGLVVNNWEISLKDIFPEFEFIIRQDSNITNSYSIENLASRGADLFQISPEMSVDEIFDIKKNTNKNLEVLIYGRPYEMILKYDPESVVKSRFKNGNNIKDLFIKSKDGEKYRIKREKDFTIIKNDSPIIGFKYIKEIRKTGVNNFFFVIEDDEDYKFIIDTFYSFIYNNDENRLDKIFKSNKEGHFKRGVL